MSRIADPGTRKQIEQAAKTRFKKQGYRETTMKDIAEEAGVSPGTIYNYYKGKKELFDSLNMPEMEGVRPVHNKKRAQILKAALSLFGEKGLEGTTMEEIAGRVGISKASLYLYCDSKEDLLIKVLQQSSFNISSRNKKLDPAGIADWESAIKEVGREYLNISKQSERVALLRSVIRESSKYPEIGRLYYEQGFRSACENMVKYLQIAKQQGAAIQDVDLMGAVQSYFGSLQSYIILKSVIRGIQLEQTADAYLELTTQLFLNGLKADK